MPAVSYREQQIPVRETGKLRNLFDASLCPMEYGLSKDKSELTVTSYASVRLAGIDVIRDQGIGQRAGIRKPCHIQTHFSDDFLICLPHEADVTLAQSGSQSRFSVGSFSLLSTALPFSAPISARHRQDAFSHTIVRVPGASLRSRVARIDDHCGQPLVIRPGVGRIMAALFDLALDEGVALTDDEARHFSNALLDAIADTALAAPEIRVSHPRIGMSARERLRQRAGDFILSHLSDPDLGAEDIPASAACRLRYLRAAFADTDCSLGSLRAPGPHPGNAAGRCKTVSLSIVPSWRSPSVGASTMRPISAAPIGASSACHQARIGATASQAHPTETTGHRIVACLRSRRNEATTGRPQYALLRPSHDINNNRQMIDNLQLLKLARNASATVAGETANPEHRMVLASVDVLITELLLREDPGFYLDHIARGKALLAEGRTLAASLGKVVPNPSALRDDLNAELRGRVLNAEIDRLGRSLIDVVNQLDENASSAEKAWLVGVADWESGLYLHRAQRLDTAPAAKATSVDEAAVLAYLQRRFPERSNLRITSFVPLAGGFSKKTILVDIEDDSNHSESIVFRVDQDINLFQFDGSDIGKEFHIIQLVQKHGLAVAKPLWLENDASHLGHRFMVSRRAVGKTYGNHFGSDSAFSNETIGPIVDSLISTLVRLHSIRIDPSDADVQQSHLRDWLPYPSVTEATRYCVTEYLPRLIRLTDVPMTPQMQRVLNWLARNVPEVDEPAVITHLDYGFNNIIFDGTNISAVLDWETSHPGDPAADIAWTHHQNLAPYMSMGELLARYRAGTGREISEFRLAYWRVVNCMGGIMACLSSLRALETQAAPPVNIAVMAFQYVAAFGPQFNMLIEAAENARGN